MKTERTSLLNPSETVETTKEKIVYDIFNGALSLGRYQSGFLFLCAIGSSILSYRSGLPFYQYGLDGEGEIPGIQTINNLFGAYSADYVNAVLNFYFLMDFFYKTIQYYNEYQLKKKHNLKPKLARDSSKLIPALIYTAVSALPFGALALKPSNKGSKKERFFEQLVVFSVLHGFGSYSNISYLVATCYLFYSVCSKKSTARLEESAENSLEKDIAIAENNPGLFLNQGSFSEKQELDLQKLIAAIKEVGKAETNSDQNTINVWKNSRFYRPALLSTMIVILLFSWCVAAYGYLFLTKNDGLDALAELFKTSVKNAAERWTFGSFFFSPFFGLALQLIINTATNLLTFAENSINRIIHGKKQSQKEYWSNWIYLTRPIIGVFIFAGYFFGFLSGSAPIALNNEKANLNSEWSRWVTCFGTATFNGYAFFGIGLLLDWYLTLLLSYNKQERTHVSHLSQANHFFSRHKNDLEHETKEYEPSHCCCV